MGFVCVCLCARGGGLLVHPLRWDGIGVRLNKGWRSKLSMGISASVGGIRLYIYLRVLHTYPNNQAETKCSPVINCLRDRSHHHALGQ